MRAAAPPSQPTAPARPAPPRTPSATDRAVAGFIAWLKRGNPLARIGIVILFFGAAFLAKYAADNSLFPIELRFIALALGAFALLIVGWRLRERRAIYATAPAGRRHRRPVSHRVRGDAPVSAPAARDSPSDCSRSLRSRRRCWQSRRDALALAVIGTAGGFLAPILVSTGSGNYVALFTYYALLNLGVFAVAWFKTWRVLNVLGFLFTFTITGLWRANVVPRATTWSTADGFLILFFLMYVAVSILNCVRQPPNLKGYVSGSLVFGLPVVAFTLHATMISRIEYGLAWSAFALGAFYLLLGWSSVRHASRNLPPARRSLRRARRDLREPRDPAGVRHAHDSCDVGGRRRGTALARRASGAEVAALVRRACCRQARVSDI